MRIVLVRRQQHLRLVRSQQSHKRDARSLSKPNVTIRLIEVQTHVEFHDARGVERFLRADLRRAARSHFTAREITHARAITERFQFEKCSRNRQLRVIRMRKNREHIDLVLGRTHGRSLA